MNEKNRIEALSNLVQLDIDAVYAYDQALKEINDPIIKDRLPLTEKSTAGASVRQRGQPDRGVGTLTRR
jgi:hypothetical protein